ncbi:hypothetical protein A3F03_02035 [Candidatus Roizmanbacteria bacterium RIFCSPHIGHO2_12_FULL_41_11]|uniref:Type 4a pilus biogenesis protein PilO n=3 Tax=Candidatus Roizmaniibacteriota TaxID=1752723 RepID=A0A1F7JRM8_9BACT|nr:MAG: hypothetical protein A3F03_02035 [Candidatus Roizmanbacteria bacterium RIFCSPHIGHO2_12_FULL_41_11]OGK51365.1 MAG: hypothetical protein A2966_04565 [Candidatus Roizmanbacteria bacterium RIFCSPLOWO2_01_FULL_41_22]OGK58269.1 MAG: hypothetical protein A3H86_03495 [Candidatus Roizmanbacteria bacterium RIFCSPLOWO2_02_FULL_41_9]
MNSKVILQKLTEKKVKDYTFTILFFLIFSFFLIGVIRPNLLTAFELQSELVSLKKINIDYEKIILQIVDHQTILENNRDKLPLLGQAVPAPPLMYELTQNIQNAAQENAVNLSKLEIKDVSLKSKQAKAGLKSYYVAIETQDTLPNIEAFFNSLMNQRRLKTLHNLSYTLESSASESAIMKIDLQVKGYYSL